MNETEVRLEDIRAARVIIEPHVHRTPMLGSATLSGLSGATLRLKAENLQKTGAFKPRGAINALSHLSPGELERGVIAVSAGNHAMAVAFAARIAGTSAIVVMPETATRSKIAAVEGYGGEVRLVPPDDLMERMEEIRTETGRVFIHPFDNPHVIAGQGTVGLEIVEDAPDVEVVVVPVGGGGLISGVATAVKSVKPDVRVIGVEPEQSNIVARSLQAGEPLSARGQRTMADGLNAPWAGPVSLALIRRYVDEMASVGEAEIARAMRLVVSRTKLLVEPAGAAGIAALVGGHIEGIEGKRVVAVLSGGNVDLETLAAAP